MKQKPVIERLYDNCEVITETGCWIWIKCVNEWGYGQIKINGKSLSVHRVSWEIHNNKPVPQGMLVCHKCDTPSCINPYHLFLGTNKDNVRDSVSRGRRAKPSVRFTFSGRKHKEAIKARWSRARSGELNNKSKLSNNDVLNIRKDSRPLSIIAEEYGICVNHVSRIRCMVQWKKIPNQVEE